jgi:hypothetical protein
MKKAQNVVFNLKRRIPSLFYCVKHIQGQFKTYLKLRNIHSKQIAKTIPTVACWAKPCRDILLKPFCFVSYRYIICKILFLLICHALIIHCAVWCPAAVLCF